MSYRPLSDLALLARSKVKYYGAFPNGSLHRMRHLLAAHINDPVLFVCGGMVRKYPERGFGPNDRTLDLDPACEPDFLQDARGPLPLRICGDKTCLTCEDGNCETDVKGHPWRAVLIDRPYTEADAQRYLWGEGAGKLPELGLLLRHALQIVPVGCYVGTLDYLWPRPPKVGGKDAAVERAVLPVSTGRGNRMRVFLAWERML